MSLQDELESFRTPLLKILVLLLYILPVPLLILAGMEFLRAIRPGVGQEATMWITRGVVCLIIAAFCWISSTGLYRMSKNTLYFTIVGFIVLLLSLTVFLVKDPEIYMMINVSQGFVYALIATNLLAIVVLLKNRDKFR